MVYHIYDEDLDWPTLSDVDEECADGLWQWGLTAGASTPADRSDDVLDKITPTYDSGCDEKDWISLTVGSFTYDDYLALTPPADNPNCGWRYKANNAEGKNEDFFNPDYADVFSAWSNPSTCLHDMTTQSYKGFQITGYNSTTHAYTLNIGVDQSTLQSFKPSKPQNLKTQRSANNHPLLTWTANREPNLSAYKIYKKTTANGSWSYLGQCTGASYEDGTEWCVVGVPTTHPVWYRITAINTVPKESVPSNESSIIVNGIAPPAKDNPNNDLSVKTPTEYSLIQNFPNPFNPATVINYQIPTSSRVTLKVFDILGKEVMTLVDSYKEAGSYKATFDASNLPSGVYVYKIEAGTFLQAKKMILAK